MADTVTRVTNKSWGSRLLNAIVGALLGIVLCVGGCGLQFWNEGRAVKRAQALAEGRHDVVDIAIHSVNPENAGKLVHMTGDAKSDEVLKDDTFGVSATTIKLIRNVEMYQWQEKTERKTRKKLGGGEETVTTYTYTHTWSDKAIRSSGFEEPAGHTNPPMPLFGQTFVAQHVRLGDFELSPAMLNDWTDSKSLPIAAGEGQPPESYARRGGGFYRGANPDSPAVGDVRVNFEVVKPGVVSIIGRQVGNTFEDYTTASGKQLEQLLTPGTHSADAMFAAEETENRILAWVLRFAGFLALVIGFSLILGPLSVFSDVIPFIGRIVGLGVLLISLVLGAVISLVTIGVAWLFYRPVLGIALIAAAVAILVYWRWRRVAQGQAAEALASFPPPPPPPPPQMA